MLNEKFKFFSPARARFLGLLCTRTYGPTSLFLQPLGDAALPSFLLDYPVTLIQFLMYLYRNVHDVMNIFMTGDVLSNLAATLFPFKYQKDDELASPDDEFQVRTFSSPVSVTRW